MFGNFDIDFSNNIDLDYLAGLNVSLFEIERLFYGEYHVYYPNEPVHYMIGHTGSKMLSVNFRLEYEQNLIIIEEINYSRDYEVDEKYCKIRCR